MLRHIAIMETQEKLAVYDKSKSISLREFQMSMSFAFYECCFCVKKTLFLRWFASSCSTRIRNQSETIRKVQTKSTTTHVAHERTRFLFRECFDVNKVAMGWLWISVSGLILLIYIVVNQALVVKWSKCSSLLTRTSSCFQVTSLSRLERIQRSAVLCVN